MNIYKKAIIATQLSLICVFSLSAQTRITKEEYVDKYKSIAVAHMERYGIPASITMAQGVLESDAGNSWLSKNSNNHFGIKCKRNWTGATISYDDDAKGECFRKYPSVEESYADHATFLDSQPRYDSIFAYSSTDYKSWARGLKAAGYATAPDYAARLVKIIEDYKLYLLDQPNGDYLYAMRNQTTPPLSADEWFANQSSVERPSDSGSLVDPDNYRVTINAHNGYNVYATNGVNYILAKENDTFENIGKNFRLSPRNLRKFNDLSSDAQPMMGEVIYIERKKKRWDGNAVLHTAREGETAYAISQSYAIRKSSIEKMNKLDDKSVMTTGQKIKIQ